MLVKAIYQFVEPRILVNKQEQAQNTVIETRNFTQWASI